MYLIQEAFDADKGGVSLRVKAGTLGMLPHVTSLTLHILTVLPTLTGGTAHTLHHTLCDIQWRLYIYHWGVR